MKKPSSVCHVVEKNRADNVLIDQPYLVLKSMYFLLFCTEPKLYDPSLLFRIARPRKGRSDDPAHCEKTVRPYSSIFLFPQDAKGKREEGKGVCSGDRVWMLQRL
jgi:hypothetical protein